MRKRKKRNGVAAVEAAVCMPLLALIFFGSIEVAGGIFQEYNAQASAFELAKVALKKGTTCDNVQAMAAQILPQNGFDTYSITIDVEPRTVNSDSVDSTSETTFNVPQSGSTTNNLQKLPRGTLLRLTLTINRPPISGIGLSTNFLTNQIVSDCVFVREF